MGLMHGADWAETVCGLLVPRSGGAQRDTDDVGSCLGVDARAAAAGLPQYDSLDMWPLLSGANATSPRTEVPVGPGALVTTRWKLLLGRVSSAGWDGPLFPNASSPTHDVEGAALECGTGGCLFDLQADPGEQVDLAAQEPAVLATLKARLAELTPGFYSNNETAAAFTCAHNAALQVGKPCACDAAAVQYGGYVGPWALPRYA